MEIDYASFCKWVDITREGFDSFTDQVFIDCLLCKRYYVGYTEYAYAYVCLLGVCLCMHTCVCVCVFLLSELNPNGKVYQCPHNDNRSPRC